MAARHPAPTLSIRAIQGLPEVQPGDDLAALLASSLGPDWLQPGDVLVVAHKVVSKAEGRIRALSEVTPGERALRLAREHGKDPRHVQVILEESRTVLRAARGVLICVTRHGFVCANAGVDASNVTGADTVVLLPINPDHSAREIRARLRERLGVAPGVLITDSFGRAWRHGQVDVAIGSAGIEPIDDWRGRVDASGRELRATRLAVADQLAAAADLVSSKDGMLPAAVIRGVAAHVREDDGPGAAALLRPESDDLFR